MFRVSFQVSAGTLVSPASYRFGARTINASSAKDARRLLLQIGWGQAKQEEIIGRPHLKPRLNLFFAPTVTRQLPPWSPKPKKTNLGRHSQAPPTSHCSPGPIYKITSGAPSLSCMLWLHDGGGGVGAADCPVRCMPPSLLALYCSSDT